MIEPLPYFPFYPDWWRLETLSCVKNLPEIGQDIHSCWIRFRYNSLSIYLFLLLITIPFLDSGIPETCDSKSELLALRVKRNSLKGLYLALRWFVPNESEYLTSTASVKESSSSTFSIKSVWYLPNWEAMKHFHTSVDQKTLLHPC